MILRGWTCIQFAMPTPSMNVLAGRGNAVPLQQSCCAAGAEEAEAGCVGPADWFGDQVLYRRSMQSRPLLLLPSCNRLRYARLSCKSLQRWMCISFARPVQKSTRCCSSKVVALLVEIRPRQIVCGPSIGLATRRCTGGACSHNLFCCFHLARLLFKSVQGGMYIWCAVGI